MTRKPGALLRTGEVEMQAEILNPRRPPDMHERERERERERRRLREREREREKENEREREREREREASGHASGRAP